MTQTKAPVKKLDRETIEGKLKKLIADKLQVEESAVIPTADFHEDLGADSLDLVDLVMAFEEEFKLEIPDRDAATLKTPGAALDYVVLKLNI